eukprot:m51a1_g11041 putative gpi ethanolamine phosphate transferase 2 isoform x6 (973) ;mRNA; f:444364-447804
MAVALVSPRVFGYLTVLFVALPALVGVAEVAIGFFPVRPDVRRSSDLDALERNSGIPPPRFTRAVVLLVDALRADFVYSNASKMDFTKLLIRQGRVYAYEARAAAPTVTLPRIKALTTGASPGFVDVVRNFAASDLRQDNVVRRLRAAGRRLVFYGDDTWLKLFPASSGVWERSEGTTSFDVRDTTTVDANVTRNLDRELEQPGSWDVMVLHYLGLDHVGHLEGPASPLMPRKQREMDAVVRRIYDAVPDDTLIVLLGDHGMSQSGNHGGGSAEETSTAMAFISKSFNTGRSVIDPEAIDQTDLCPTLAALMGVPMPRESTGAVVRSLLSSLMPQRDYLRSLELNTVQLRTVLESYRKDSRIESLLKTAVRARTMFKDFAKKGGNDKEAAKVVGMFSTFLDGAKQRLSSEQGSLDWYRITLGLVCLFLSAFTSIAILWGTCPPTSITPLVNRLPSLWSMFSVIFAALLFFVGLHMTYCMGSGSHERSRMCSADSSNIVVIGICCLSASVVLVPLLGTPTLRYFLRYRPPSFLRETAESMEPVPLSLQWAVICAGTLVHSLSMFSSSLVEEEQSTWRYLTSTLLLAYSAGSIFRPRGLRANKAPVLAAVVLVLHRVCSSWNSTGARGTPGRGDVAGFLDDPSNAALTRLTCVLASVAPAVYAHAFTRTYKNMVGTWGKRIFTASVVASCFIVMLSKLQVPYAGEVVVARILYTTVGIGFVVGLFWPHFGNGDRDSKGALHVTASLCTVALLPLLMQLHRRHNMMLVVLTALQAHLFGDLATELENGNVVLESVLSRVAAMIWLSKTSFFNFGNSNSISTIDFSGAYAGLADFNIFVVGINTTLITYTGPIMFLGFTVAMIARLNHMQYPRSADGFEQGALGAALALLCSVCLPLLCSAASLALQHSHLFVWSVYSPKVVYAAADLVCACLAAAVLAWNSYVVRLRLLRYQAAELATIRKAQLLQNAAAKSKTN